MRSGLRGASLVLLLAVPALGGPSDDALLDALRRERPVDRAWEDDARRWFAACPPGQGLGPDGAPEDGAPLDLLLWFWGQEHLAVPGAPEPRPSARVVERLAAAVLDGAAPAGDLLPRLPPARPAAVADPTSRRRRSSRRPRPSSARPVSCRW